MSRVLPYNAKQWEIPALLDGRKTVTRRVIKPPYFVEGDENDKRSLITCRTAAPSSKLYKEIGSMPYPENIFEITDILYVRETWNEDVLFEDERRYFFRADENDDMVEEIDWRPSIHMPKAAARIWLKVTDVRVERLQDIMYSPHGYNNQIVKEGCRHGCDFIALWDSTIKKSDLALYGWNVNPWVWVIEFERCEKPEGV